MPLTAGVAPLRKSASALAPGLLLCGLIALAAQFLSDHYGAPAMLMALLLGLAMHFVVEDGNRCAEGVNFGAKTVLRVGVALLGARISFQIFSDLGWGVLWLTMAGLIGTVLFGLALAKMLGRSWWLAVLTSGAVAICGASAAMAIAAVLPRRASSDRDLGFTVFSVTLLSTVAMVLYPIIASVLGLDLRATAIFLGGTIHDVAQVVGAGFSVSEPVGETATTLKLIRVSLLAPFVVILTLVVRRVASPDANGTGAPPLIPGFVLAFLGLALVNSLGLLPEWLQSWCWTLSRWAMLAAVAAVGVKTELKRIVEIPPQALVLIVAETAFIAVLVLYGTGFVAGG